MLVNSYLPVALSVLHQNAVLHHLGDNQKILHEQNVEKALVELFAVENDSIRTAACQTVTAMCKNLSSRDTFQQFGIGPNNHLLRV